MLRTVQRSLRLCEPWLMKRSLFLSKVDPALVVQKRLPWQARLTCFSRALSNCTHIHAHCHQRRRLAKRSSQCRMLSVVMDLKEHPDRSDRFFSQSKNGFGALPFLVQSVLSKQMALSIYIVVLLKGICNRC